MTCSHVFGCPVYVLDAALQDGKKIPKWNPRARLGRFLGFSELHSLQVPLVLNVSTGRISPQFHVIFDDKFETVHSLPSDEPLDKQWAKIIQLGRECFLDTNYDADEQPILPSLTELIKQYNEIKEGKQRDAPMTSIDFTPTDYLPNYQPPTSKVPASATNQLVNQPRQQQLLP